MSLSYNDRLALLQHAISKYDSEPLLKEKLKGMMSEKDIERGIDTLIATQKVRRIGPDMIPGGGQSRPSRSNRRTADHPKSSPAPAYPRPTRTPPIRPGPAVAATASRRAKERPA